MRSDVDFWCLQKGREKVLMTSVLGTVRPTDFEQVLPWQEALPEIDAPTATDMYVIGCA